MDERGVLDLAIARIPSLKAAERILIAESLDRERDLSLISTADIERMIGRRLVGQSWNSRLLLQAAEGDRAKALRSGIDVVSYLSTRYPPLLRELPDPPVVIFCRGTLPDPERPMAAIVGTREPSPIGLSTAYEFARQFGTRGVAVVSGLARGIDAMAHRGNLDGGAPTVAVLGSGLDEIYPKSNRATAARIVESNGALISEYPPGEPPRKWHFPARNRIIAGLSRATVVVEAPSPSGALITADFALDFGRDLWVCSAPLSSAFGEGCRSLADDGARVAKSAYEIVDDWGLTAGTVELRDETVKKNSSACDRWDGGNVVGAALAEELALSLEIEQR